MSVSQVVSALLMRYRWGLGGQAGTFGCLSNKVSDSVTLSKLLVHPVHVRCVLLCCCISAVLECPEHLHTGVVPDFVTMAKGIGNGHPISAIVTSQKITEKHNSIAPSIYPSVCMQHTAMLFDMTLCAVCVQGLVDVWYKMGACIAAPESMHVCRHV